MNSASKKRKSGASNRQLSKPCKKQKSQDADTLPWRELSLPSGLEDYEGFYSIEEVDGVEVSRDHIGGLSLRQRHVAEDSLPDEDDWSGFSDQSTPSFSENDRSHHSEVDSDYENHPAVSKERSSGINIDDHMGSCNSFEALNMEATKDSEADIRSWRRLRLSEDTLSSLAKLGFSDPTPIQSASLPHALDGKDLVGKAPTGSGKTLAFGLPVIEKWLATSEKQAKALVIEPTRELALQVADHLTALQHPCHSKEPRIATLTGGLSIQKQRRLLQHADIVIATPGRLWDIMEGDATTRRHLQRIQTLVIDEADRLLSQGHFKELGLILDALDRQENEADGADITSNVHQRQTLVFSATFAKELQQKLAKKVKLKGLSANADSMTYLLQKLNFRQQPEFVDVNPGMQMASNLAEGLLQVTDNNKDMFLYALLLLYQPHASTRALVFVNSIAAVRRLVPFLAYLGIDALALHSNMEQKARLKSVERFVGSKKAGKGSGLTSSSNYSVLVATDIAARGLDLPEIHLVVHYHLPRTADMYVHRSGRTARAGAYGASVLMSAPNEASGVQRLVAQVHQGSSGNIVKKHLQFVSVEDRILQQLRPRTEVAKRIADVEQAKEKASSRDRLMEEAADDLGVDSDGGLSQFKDSRGKGGRGKRRREMEAEASSMTKAELKQLKRNLKQLLSQRINTGVSPRYIANGLIDMDALLAEGQKPGGFLGQIQGLNLQMK